MLASSAVARHAALGNTALCSFATGAALASQTSVLVGEVTSGFRGDLVSPIASSPPSSATAATSIGESRCACETASITGILGPQDSGHKYRFHVNLGPWGGLFRHRHYTSLTGVSAEIGLPPPDFGLRALHSSPAASAPAPTAAAAAAAAQPVASTSNSTSSSGGRGGPEAVGAAARGAGRRQLSPHAQEFQRKFFQLININFVAQGAAGAAAQAAVSQAQASTANSQALRMLMAWLEEGSAALTAEQQQQQQQLQGGVTLASSAAPSDLAAGVAAPYRLDQPVIDRAMEALWRLYYREELQVRRSGAHGNRQAEPGGDPAADSRGGLEGRMGLRELLTAAAVLAAAAPAMGLTFKRQHYDLLLELYSINAVEDQKSRRGLAQRMLNVRQQMVQQMLPLSQFSVNYILSAVRHDPELAPEARLAAALKVIERDLPVASMSVPAHSAADQLARPLRSTLQLLLKDAARAGDWTAYHKLEAVLVSRTRTAPPYDVLLEVLDRAGATGQRELAVGVLAQMEQLEAAHPHGLTASAQAAGGAQRRYQQQQQQQQLEFQEWERERGALTSLLELAADSGDLALAEKSYARLRKVLWRDCAREEAAAAADGAEKGDGSGDGAGQAQAGLSTGMAAVQQAAVVQPAPPAATLMLLGLVLERRDWRRVFDLVAELAELQSLTRRSDGRVLKVLQVQAPLDRSVSAYGGLAPVSEALIASEADTVAYYSELLRRVAEAAAAGTSVAPFGGSPVPYGPPLRAAAARRDLASVSEIVKQMRGLQCPPGSDSYAAVMDASIRAGKAARVSGLMDLMADEQLYPNAAVWEVQLAAATEAADGAALAAVADRALTDADKGPIFSRGVADIDQEVLSAALAKAEALGDSGVAASLKLLRARSQDLRSRRQSSYQQARRARAANRASAQQQQRGEHAQQQQQQQQ